MRDDVISFHRDFRSSSSSMSRKLGLQSHQARPSISGTSWDLLWDILSVLAIGFNNNGDLMKYPGPKTKTIHLASRSYSPMIIHSLRYHRRIVHPTRVVFLPSDGRNRPRIMFPKTQVKQFIGEIASPAATGRSCYLFFRPTKFTY